MVKSKRPTLWYSHGSDTLWIIYPDKVELFSLYKNKWRPSTCSVFVAMQFSKTNNWDYLGEL